jgi:hypothetical protein
MKDRDQDRLLTCSIAILCLAALVYGGTAMLAWLVGRGVNIKEVDAAAWTQAVGSVAAIAALFWQRSHEVAVARENARRDAAERQNGARRLVQAAANICDFAAEQWPVSPPLSVVDCGLLQARLQAIGGALKQVNAHALPSWKHTECVLAAVTAMDALRLELSRGLKFEPPLVDRGSAAVVTPSWVDPFKAMAKEFGAQLQLRAVLMSTGLEPSVDTD